MKAILHNKVLVDITKKVKDYDFIIVDKFAKESNYFKYLKETKTIVKDITFLEKAENKHLSVAASSIISRYIFLKEIKKLSDKLKINLPLGAGNKVDKTAKMLIDKYGEDILKVLQNIILKTQKNQGIITLIFLFAFKHCYLIHIFFCFISFSNTHIIVINYVI